MKPKASLVVPAWVGVNIVLACLLFVFDAGLFAELLYLVAAVPALAFALAVGRSQGFERGEVRTMPGGTWNVVWLAVGWTLLGVGAIYLTWIWILGALISIAAAVGLARSRPRPIEAPAAVLAGLPVRTWAPGEDVEPAAEEQPPPPETSDEGERRPPLVVKATVAIALAALLRRIVAGPRRRSRRDEAQ